MVEFLLSRLKTEKLTSMKWTMEQISLRGGSCIYEELRAPQRLTDSGCTTVEAAPAEEEEDVGGAEEA